MPVLVALLALALVDDLTRAPVTCEQRTAPASWLLGPLRTRSGYEVGLRSGGSWGMCRLFEDVC